MSIRKGNDIIAQLGAAMVDTYCDYGICPCIKHLPGHGRAKVDPHLGLPIIDCSMKDFEQDMDYIYTSFMSDYGMDISKENMHWWNTWFGLKPKYIVELECSICGKKKVHRNLTFKEFCEITIPINFKERLS